MDLPLTQFILKLLAYTPAQLAKASADKASQHYGIRIDHAEGYLRLERQVRGMG